MYKKKHSCSADKCENKQLIVIHICQEVKVIDKRFKSLDLYDIYYYIVI